jgi:uncharacterized membrane protein
VDFEHPTCHHKKEKKMITLLLAWINAKYNAGYELLFVFSVWMDFRIIAGLLVN